MGNSDLASMFHSNEPSTLSIDGSAMKALKIACDEFLASEKDVCEFIITISNRNHDTENEGHFNDIFIVTFLGKLAPGKRGLGSANRVPGSVSYFISRDSWEIIREQGIK